MNRIVISILQRVQQNRKCFHTTLLSTSQTRKVVEESKKAKLPKLDITLIGSNQSMSVIALEEAQKIAKRRGLHLVKVQDNDPKTNRSVFKLLTQAELIEEELQELKPSKSYPDKNKSAAKVTEKSLTINSRIEDNDLESRLKNIRKWLAKNYKARILIQSSADDTVKCDKIFKTIEKSISEPEVIGKIVQKSSKNSIIKFVIIPFSTISEDKKPNSND